MNRILQLKNLIGFAYIWTRDILLFKKHRNRLLYQGKWYNYGMPLTVVDTKPEVNYRIEITN